MPITYHLRDAPVPRSAPATDLDGYVWTLQLPAQFNGLADCLEWSHWSLASPPKPSEIGRSGVGKDLHPNRTSTARKPDTSLPARGARTDLASRWWLGNELVRHTEVRYRLPPRSLDSWPLLTPRGGPVVSRSFGWVDATISNGSMARCWQARCSSLRLNEIASRSSSPPSPPPSKSPISSCHPYARCPSGAIVTESALAPPTRNIGREQ